MRKTTLKGGDGKRDNILRGSYIIVSIISHASHTPAAARMEIKASGRMLTLYGIYWFSVYWYILFPYKQLDGPTDIRRDARAHAAKLDTDYKPNKPLNKHHFR